MDGVQASEIDKLEPPAACAELLKHLQSIANPDNVAGMVRFGISPNATLGVSVTTLRAIARPIMRARRSDGIWRHSVAAELWRSEIHEARILAVLLDDPALVTHDQALAWASDSDSWDITDQLCMNLLDRTDFAYELTQEWSNASDEFVKRAAFSLMASLASHDKSAADERFLPMLVAIERQAGDPRNFVKKSVNWALRGIGKRSQTLHGSALDTARRLAGSEDGAARWIGRGALRELDGAAVRARLGLS